MSTTLRAALAQVKPTADASADANIADVVGIKADTVAGTSLIALAKYIQKRGRQIVTRAADALPQTADEALFTVTGKVNIIQVIGTVTTICESAGNNTKLKFNPSVGSDTDICAVVDLNAAAVGTLYTITGTIANAGILSPNAALPKQASPLLIDTGDIEIDCAASRTGALKWTVVWEPVDADATVVATAIA